MPTNPSSLRNDQSVKLSVTVKSRLEKKYNPKALAKINKALENWKSADAKRSIQTVHVHVDDPTEMNNLGVAPVLGEATPEKIKQAIDDLWNKLTPTPDYLVLFGSDDIVPMFPVPNPSFGNNSNTDTDEIVPTDNPYATHLSFSASDTDTYRIPERAIGRIPDMVSAPGAADGSGDSEWFITYLDAATNWEPRAASVYNTPYAIVTAEAGDAGTAFMQKTFTNNTLQPLLCPPHSDAADSPTTRDELSAALHMIKCHGNKEEAAFYGFPDAAQHTRDNSCAAITSAILAKLPNAPTVVATMCCYGAQIFAPNDAYTWPVASTYLRKGALGFVGPTMMAWVHTSDVGPADWIVQSYLKNILAGESIGNALLASKQNYHSFYSLDDDIFADPDVKTLIEFILLGDPSIHPVKSAQSSTNLLAIQSRRRRRDARAKLATGMRECLPRPLSTTDAEKALADKVFIKAKNEIAKIAKNDIMKLKDFGIDPAVVQVKKLEAPVPGSPCRESLQFYWGGRRLRGRQKQFCVLRTETDLKGKLVPGSTKVVYTS
jgi:hypothetical protein